MNIDTFIKEFRSKARPEDRPGLDQLAALPEVQAVLGREAEALHVKRQQAAAAIAEAPAKYAAATAAGEKVCAIAVAKVAEAEAALPKARDELQAARAVLASRSALEQNEIAELRNELVKTADARIDDLLFHVEDLIQMTRHVAWSQTFPNGRDMFSRRKFSHVSNLPEVTHARNELTRVRDESLGLKLVAITRVDLTERLRSMVFDLEAALTPFDMAVIQVTETGAIVRERSAARCEMQDAVLRKAGAPADALHQPAAAGPARARRALVQSND